MIPVSSEPEYQVLMRRLENVVKGAVANDISLLAYRANIGPVRSTVQDQGLTGKVIGNGESFLIALKMDENTTIYCDIMPSDSVCITFRRAGRLAAIMDHRPFLSTLYVNETIRDAKARGERTFSDGEKVISARLAVIDGKFNYKSLDAAITEEFGYGLNVTVYPVDVEPTLMKQPTMYTPPIVIDFDEQLKSGKSTLVKLKIPARIDEIPLREC